MCSNSSRFLCRLRNAAARFLTSRASRLLKPVTSGGTKSLLLIRSPEERVFLVTPRVGAAARFAAAKPDEGWTDRETRVGLRLGEEGGEMEGEGDSELGGKSKTWCVGTQSCSLSDADSELKRNLSILE